MKNIVVVTKMTSRMRKIYGVPLQINNNNKRKQKQKKNSGKIQFYAKCNLNK